jgi:hypothetical protein
MSLRVVGADAHPHGWVGIELRDGVFARAVLASTLYDLVARCSGTAAIGVRVPLGLLPDRFRAADALAAAKLGPRAPASCGCRRARSGTRPTSPPPSNAAGSSPGNASVAGSSPGNASTGRPGLCAEAQAVNRRMPSTGASRQQAQADAFLSE